MEHLGNGGDDTPNGTQVISAVHAAGRYCSGCGGKLASGETSEDCKQCGGG